MSLLGEQLDRQREAVSSYLLMKTGVGIAMLDSSLVILDCNGGFLALVGLNEVPRDRPLADFLELGAMAHPCPEELTLQFSRRTGFAGYLRCRFTPAEDGWLFFCERLTLHESQVINEMARLNSELLAIQRELAHKNAQLDVLNGELEVSRESLWGQHLELQQAFRSLQKETAARLQAVEASKSSEQMLIQQNRMAAVGEMLSKLAHHWRQPLNLIGLSIQELRYSYRQGELDQQQLDENVERSMQVLNQLSRSIDALMEISSPSHQKRRFRVDLTIERAAALVKDSMQAEGIVLGLHCSEEVTADGYRSEYAQVVLSILSNARDALLDHAAVNPRITIACWSEQGRSVVTISDNGGGIVQDAMEKMFDAFFTTKGPGKGTGINLFLAKMIIEKKMGGNLTVRNAREGAEFRIEV